MTNSGNISRPPKYNPALKETSYTKAGAVQNTWYTAATLKDVDIIGFFVRITGANETVEIRVTVDGVVYVTYGGVALTAGGNDITGVSTSLVYDATVNIFTQTAAAGSYATTNSLDFLKGRSITIEIRKTTNAGAATLSGYTKYRQW